MASVPSNGALGETPRASAKLESFNPGGGAKDRTARALVAVALERGAWLTEVLSGGVAEALRERGLRLYFEPGRSLVDGCELTLVEVAFTKTRSDGVPPSGPRRARRSRRSWSAPTASRTN